MKKFFAALLIALTLSAQAWGASQWTKTEPAGSTNASDIDLYLTTNNNEALDRLVGSFRRNCTVMPSSASTLSVLAGEIAISNAAGTVVRWRKNTSATSVTWSDIDTGAEASATQYYVYAVADADATTFTIKISASSSAPSGVTYYRQIGYFYNNSSSDIVNVGNVKGGDVSNKMQVTGTDDISSTTGTTYTDMTGMTMQFVSSGRPVHVRFNAPVDASTSLGVYANIMINGSQKTQSTRYEKKDTNGYPDNLSVEWTDYTLSAGVHTIKVQWKCSAAGTIYQTGSTDGYRILTAEEL